MYTIGYDIGSSSIKASLVSLESGQAIATVQQPDQEMSISAPSPGWAEQDPELWWQYICAATKDLLREHPDARESIIGIGISYQMHGLVLVDKEQQVLRPSIIWCDSRAVEVGEEAFASIGEDEALSCLLNSPGNFTAAKLGWVKKHEPNIYERIDKFMLPGDYIAMKLTGDLRTTVSGLSEGVFWDFKHQQVSQSILDHFGFTNSILADLVPTCGVQGNVNEAGSSETGLPIGIPVGYRAGDQPNNALSLNVLHPGEVAATGGTSGVVYGVLDQATYDDQSRVNGFAHVNHSSQMTRIGVLLCVNGAGRLYAWLRQMIGKSLNYADLESLAEAVPAGADGLTLLPFGNGAERILGNKDIGAHLSGLQLNRHGQGHLIRAGLEGIAFAFNYGIEIMKDMGIDTSTIKVGNDNLFQSKIFAETLATLAGARIEIMNTTGATGAGLAAGFGVGYFASLEEAMSRVQCIGVIEPGSTQKYAEPYRRWKEALQKILSH